MAWLTANWFWVLIFIAFIAMHIFGHGGHSDHGVGDRHPTTGESEKGGAQDRVVNASSSEHHH